MESLCITAKGPLSGSVAISGSKNAVLPMLVTSVLTSDPMVIQNIPYLQDVTVTIELLRQMGVEIIVQENMDISLCSKDIYNFLAPYDVVKTMRASILALGPLVARYGKAKVSLPGGCAIGTRPVDIHVSGLQMLGARVEVKNGYIEAEASRLRGTAIDLPSSTVTGTENLMMAATLAKGITFLRNAAREPEVTDLANCLRKMGASIEGDGSSTIVIEGKKYLNGCSYEVLPDRVESGTYLIAAAMTRGQIRVNRTKASLLHSVLVKLEECGAFINSGKDYIELDMRGRRPKSVDVTTAPYPGFPTDMQAQFTSLNAVAEGIGVITENIFENRFMHVFELQRMGAKITKNQNSSAIVEGIDQLQGAQVMATDLRASASLILAGLVAAGQTVVDRIYHIDRGYEHIEEKFSKLGADIRRIYNRR